MFEKKETKKEEAAEPKAKPAAAKARAEEAEKYTPLMVLSHFAIGIGIIVGSISEEYKKKKRCYLCFKIIFG